MDNMLLLLIGALIGGFITTRLLGSRPPQITYVPLDPVVEQPGGCGGFAMLFMLAGGVFLFLLFS